MGKEGVRGAPSPPHGIASVSVVAHYVLAYLDKRLAPGRGTAPVSIRVREAANSILPARMTSPTL